jgi:hypothetical protein
VKKVTLLVVILLSIYATLSAGFNLSEANKFYQNQEYEKAKDSYESIVQQGIKNFTLFYNLGNTYFKLEKFGLARLYYEKAAKINPRDKDLHFNLAFLQTKLKDKEETHQSLFVHFIMNIYYFFSTNLLAVFVLIFFVLIMLTIAIMILTRGRTLKKILRVVLIIFSFLFLIFLVVTVARVQEFNSHNTAVIIDETVFAYSGPSDDFQQVFTIHEGLKVRIEKFESDGVLIKLISGNGGWIGRKSIAFI